MRFFSIAVMMISLAFIGFHPGEPSPASSSAAALQDNEANVGFQWSFGAIVGKGKQFVSITRDTVLKTGEEVKMMVRLTTDCYVYVFYYSANKEIQLLFPSELRQFQTDYVKEKNYFIPAGRAWNTLDKNTGKETFFLLASHERLLEIEATYGDYCSADASKKPALAEKLIAEIRAVRKHYATFATLAEKPITIGGNIRDIRGTGKIEEKRRYDVSEIATEISAKNFYSKTFTIDHK